MKKRPVFKVAPKKIDFGKFHAGVTSPQHDVAFTSDANIPAPNVAISGSGFSLSPYICISMSSAGENCTVGVTFTPPSKGTFHGSLTFIEIENGVHSLQKVKLVGIGLAAIATPTATATATATVTATPTKTPSPSPTVSGTPTFSATPTISATPTVSATPTGSQSPTPTSTPSPKPEIAGHVMSGGNAVSGATVKMWAAGRTGYGTGAIVMVFGTTTSAADGSFFIGSVCPDPSGDDRVYLTAQGGNAGGGSNSSLMMMAAVVGPCSDIFTHHMQAVINEVTTAGAVNALSQFLSTTSSGSVGAPSTNRAGLVNSFATAANMVDVATGVALSMTPSGAGTAPQKNLNSIANALAACDRTNGAASAACIELFDCALPGAVFSAGACSGGTGSITDTLSAALSIALNPASVSVAGINDVATKGAVYSPALASAPNDWSMPLNFAPVGSALSPGDLALDSSSRVWVVNSANSVTALNNDGTLDGNFQPTGSNFNGTARVAIDSSDHVWVTNISGNSVTALNSDGTLLGNFAPVGSFFNQPFGVAIDGSGHVWVTNNAGNTMTALNNAGTLFGNFAPSGSNFDEPFGVAIDGSGRVWVANNLGNSVTALNNAGTLFGNFAPSGSMFDNPLGVAIDGSGHVWMTNNTGNTVTALNNTGNLFGNFAPTGSMFNAPIGEAIDSSGRVWVTNVNGSTVTALNPMGTLFGNFVPPGANFSNPRAVAIDSSGNVWVANSGNASITELVGASAPVKTPFIGPPQLP